MNKRQLMYVGAMLVGVLLLILVAESKSHFPIVNRIVVAVASPFTALANYVSDGVDGVTIYFTSRSQLVAQRDKLLRDNEMLRQQNVKLKLEAQESEDLCKLLGYKGAHKEFQMSIHRVIGRDIGEFRDTFIIEGGSTSGIEKGMPVVAAAGLVGFVSDVYTEGSRVDLVTSPRCQVGGMNLRGKEVSQGIVRGRVGNVDKLILTQLFEKADFEQGDTIVTSDMSSICPSGIIIGNVEEIHSKSAGVPKEVTIISAVNFKRLRDVCVIRNYPAGLIKGKQASTARTDKHSKSKGGATK